MRFAWSQRFEEQHLHGSGRDLLIDSAQTSANTFAGWDSSLQTEGVVAAAFRRRRQCILSQGTVDTVSRLEQEREHGLGVAGLVPLAMREDVPVVHRPLFEGPGTLFVLFEAPLPGPWA